MLAFPPSESLIGTTLGNYYLEQLIGRNELGPVFLGSTDEGSTYLVRFILAPCALEAEERAAYQERFLQVAGEIVALQHRHILPLVDYGSYLGGSYLVTPNLPMQTLISALTKSGPPSLSTIGDYLEQLAQGLEYAHEQGIVHRNLSTDCIFLLRDGRLVIGDFGVMHLLELATPAGQGYPDYGSGEGRAPEQLQERSCGPYTDVYALGAVLYRLLTTHAVFRDSSREGVYAQHLHAPVTSLQRWRSDLPEALDEVIRQAMEKEPARRFQRPSELVAAYRQAVGLRADAAERVEESTSSSSEETTLGEQPAEEATPASSIVGEARSGRASFWRRLLRRLRGPGNREGFSSTG
ncbi:serine/threonine protein kinase [Thermogemmatispora onikobensis]|uniref:serine/threonine protein kinase n=1 Tax=Thermogemmatispora onikobensis TaxID=732234 RepID=UPI000853324F|nr:serine/threonine-protein kinase [Thermogemmatispora onikobensis]